MSHHEWYHVMYGIEVPAVPVSNEKLFEFVNKHSKDIAEYVSEDEIPADPEDIYAWVDGYEDSMGNMGISALIGDIINSCFIETTHDQYGNDYIGMYAYTVFPWDNCGDEWKSVTPEYIESKIRPVIEELFGECPEFYEHTIWNNG